MRRELRYRLFSMIDGLRDAARRRRGEAPHLILARKGEDLAHRYGERELGWRVIGRNYRHPLRQTEVDLVAIERDTLVVAEVKTRSSASISHPMRAIGAEKEFNVGRASMEWVRRAEALRMNVRYDVITVIVGEKETVEHHRDVFQPLRRAEV